MVRRWLVGFGLAAALLVGSVGIAGVVRAETVTPPASTQAYPPYGPGWGMMRGYWAAGGPSGDQAPPEAWQAMWSACSRFMSGWAAPATPPATAPGAGGS